MKSMYLSKLVSFENLGQKHNSPLKEYDYLFISWTSQDNKNWFPLTSKDAWSKNFVTFCTLYGFALWDHILLLSLILD